MAQKKIGAFITLDGEKQFKQAVTDCNKSLSAMKSEMALVKAETDGQANALESLQKKHTVLEKVLDTQKEKESAVKEALDHANESYKSVGEQLEKYRSDLDKAQTSLDDMKNSSSATSDEIEKQEKAVKELTDAVSKGEETYSRAGNRVKDWETKLNTARAQVIKANTELNKNAAYMKEAENATDQCATSIDAFGKKVSDSSESVVKFGEIVKANLATAALDKTKDLVLSAASGALELESAQAQFQASTALSADELERYNSVLDDLYKDNFGDSYNDVAEVMGVISQYTKETDPDVIKKMAENAMTLDDVFKMDVSETIRGADALVKSMGTDSEEAFDLIAVGAQNGLDKSGELVDNLAEYAPLWAQAGFSAGEMFEILENGLDSGAYNLDKVNDFVKEFGNSIADGRIANNLQYFSDETKTLFYNLKNGKATTKDVFFSVINDLDTMTDKQQALAIASETWSALGEDNSMAVLTSLNKLSGGYDNVHGAMEKIKNIKYDTLESKYKSLARTFQSEVAQPLLEDFFPLAEKGVEFLIEHVEDIIPVIIGVGTAIVGVKAVGAVSDVIDGFTGATEGAAGAQAVFNAVCSANPVAVSVTAALGLATGAYAVYYSQLEFVEGKTSELVRGNQELSDSMENISADAEKINLDWTDDLGDMETQGQAARNLADRLADLSSSTGNVTEKKEKMQYVCEQLNSIYPDLALSVNEETGELNKSIDTIYKAIDASEAYTKAKAAQEKLEEIAKKQVDAEMALAEAELKLQDTQERGEVLANLHRQAANDATLTDVDRTNKLEQLEQQQRLLNDSEQEIQESMGETQETLSGLGEQYSTIYDFKQEQIEKSGEVSQAYSDEAAAAEESATAVVDQETLKAQATADAAAQIAENVQSQISIFTEATNLTGEELQSATQATLDNMQSQMVAMENWAANLQTISERGVNEGLLNYLAEMGPSGAEYVAQFASMTDEQLQQASEMWQQTMDSAGTGATLAAQITGDLDEQASEIYEKMMSAGTNAAAGLTDGINTGAESAAQASNDMANGVPTAAEEALEEHSPSKVMQRIGEYVGLGLSSGIASMSSAPVTAMSNMALGVIQEARTVLNQESFRIIGQNVSQGLAQGILDGQSAVVNAVASMCASAVTEARKDLDINSPSKVFEEIGEYSAQGFGSGFENQMAYVAQSVKDSMNFESTEKVYSAQDTDTGNLENTIENALYNGLIYAMSKVNMAPNLNGLTVIGQYDGENVVKIVVNADESEKARTGGIGLFA